MGGSYLSYIARRLAGAVVIAVIVTAITFVMLRVLRPESFDDPRPLPEQTVDYLWGAFTRFDLGNSVQPPFPPVGDLIVDGLPADLSLFVGALIIGTIGGMAAGVYRSRHPRTFWSGVLGVAGMLALCAPVYWTALISISLLGDGVGRVVGLAFVDTGIYEPLTEDPLAWFGSLLVPWVVTAAPLAAVCMRMTTANIEDLGQEDFIRTALGKGLTPRAVTVRHALPAAASPTLVLAGAYTPLLVGNALLVEQVFNIPGVFRETTGAISNGDFPVLQGLVLVGALLVVIGNLAADLVLGRLDPRVRAP